MYLSPPAMMTDDDEVMKAQLTERWWLFFRLLVFFFLSVQIKITEKYVVNERLCMCVLQREFPLFLLADYSWTILYFQQNEEPNVLH